MVSKWCRFRNHSMTCGSFGQARPLRPRLAPQANSSHVRTPTSWLWPMEVPNKKARGGEKTPAKCRWDFNPSEMDISFPFGKRGSVHFLCGTQGPPKPSLSGDGTAQATGGRRHVPTQRRGSEKRPPRHLLEASSDGLPQGAHFCQGAHQKKTPPFQRAPKEDFWQAYMWQTNRKPLCDHRKGHRLDQNCDTKGRTAIDQS